MTPIRLKPQDIPIRRLAELWQAGKSTRDDAQRDDKTLKWLATNAHWYEGPKGSLWYLTARNDSIRSANLYVLNGNPWAWYHFKTSFLTKLMVLEDLRKLYVLAPSVAGAVKRTARMLGFRHEGALKEGIRFNGRLVTLEIFGLLLKEVRRNASPRSRTRKKGRKVQEEGQQKRPHARKGRSRRKAEEAR